MIYLRLDAKFDLGPKRCHGTKGLRHCQLQEKTGGTAELSEWAPPSSVFLSCGIPSFVGLTGGMMDSILELWRAKRAEGIPHSLKDEVHTRQEG